MRSAYSVMPYFIMRCMLREGVRGGNTLDGYWRAELLVSKVRGQENHMFSLDIYVRVSQNRVVCWGLFSFAELRFSCIVKNTAHALATGGGDIC
jgi:hypothetical protein